MTLQIFTLFAILLSATTMAEAQDDMGLTAVGPFIIMNKI